MVFKEGTKIWKVVLSLIIEFENSFICLSCISLILNISLNSITAASQRCETLDKSLHGTSIHIIRLPKTNWREDLITYHKSYLWLLLKVKFEKNTIDERFEIWMCPSVWLWWSTILDSVMKYILWNFASAWHDTGRKICPRSLVYNKKKCTKSSRCLPGFFSFWHQNLTIYLELYSGRYKKHFAVLNIFRYHTDLKWIFFRRVLGASAHLTFTFINV